MNTYTDMTNTLKTTAPHSAAKGKDKPPHSSSGNSTTEEAAMAAKKQALQKKKIATAKKKKSIDAAMDIDDFPPLPTPAPQYAPTTPSAESSNDMTINPAALTNSDPEEGPLAPMTLVSTTITSEPTPHPRTSLKTPTHTITQPSPRPKSGSAKKSPKTAAASRPHPTPIDIPANPPPAPKVVEQPVMIDLTLPAPPQLPEDVYPQEGTLQHSEIHPSNFPIGYRLTPTSWLRSAVRLWLQHQLKGHQIRAGGPDHLFILIRVLIPIRDESDITSIERIMHPFVFHDIIPVHGNWGREYYLLKIKNDHQYERLTTYDRLKNGILVGTAQNPGSLLIFQITPPPKRGPELDHSHLPPPDSIRSGQNSVLMELQNYPSILHIRKWDTFMTQSIARVKSNSKLGIRFFSSPQKTPLLSKTGAIVEVSFLRPIKGLDLAYVHGQNVLTVGIQHEHEVKRPKTYKSDHEYYSMHLKPLPHCNICGSATINDSHRLCPFMTEARRIINIFKRLNPPVPVPSKKAAEVFEISDRDDEFDLGTDSDEDNEEESGEDNDELEPQRKLNFLLMLYLLTTLTNIDDNRLRPISPIQNLKPFIVLLIDRSLQTHNPPVSK